MMCNNPFKINNYQVTPAEFTIHADGCDKQSLQPKFIEVLTYLAKNYGRVVPRDELIEHIWGQDSYVGEKSLTNAIWQLRKYLIACEGEEEIIKTIRKAGYQLMTKPHWQAAPAPNMPVTESIAQAELIRETDEQPSQKVPVFRIKSTYISFALITALLILLLVQQFSNDKKTEITTITSHPGSELFPAPSPDGRYVVYSQVSTNQPTNLFMKDTLQSQLPPKQLTFDNATEGHSVWSNDGQYLYFSRKDKPNKTCFYIQLRVVSQQETQLAKCPLQGGYYYLDISPDDNTLAVYNKEGSAKRTGIYFINLLSKDYEMTRFSCDRECSYKDRDMAFSPDGKYIAVSRRVNRLSENVYLINLMTNTTEQLTFNEEDIVGMSWLGNSKKLIYASQRADNRFGFIIDVNDKVSQPLHLTGFSYPSVSKHSQQLFYQERKENSSLVNLQLNDEIASSPFPVLQSNFTYESSDYSPINNLIVFSSNESGFDELWSANTDGTERKQLTNLKKTIRYPKWSHDGKRVAFLAPLLEKKGDGIYIYSLEKDRVTLLQSPFIQHNRPSWSFDDKSILSAIYGDNHTDIYSINISDAKTTRLTFDGGRYGIMTSNRTLFYTKLKKGLWRKSTDKIRQSERVIKGNIFNTLYAWTHVKGQIYYQIAYDDHYQLAVFNLNSNQQTPLLRLPLDSISTSDSITYVSQTDRLLFTSSSFPQANIKRIAASNLF